MTHRRPAASFAKAIAAASAASAASAMFAVFPFGAASALAAGNAAKPARTELVRCEVRFSYDSTRFASDALDSCLRTVDRSELRYFEVFATASPKGDTEYNRKLSERRAQALRAHLARRFPGVLTSRPLGGGENPMRGATGTVVAVNSTLPAGLAALPRDGLATEPVETPPGTGMPATLSLNNDPAATENPAVVDSSPAVPTGDDTRVSALGTGSGNGAFTAPGTADETRGGGLSARSRDADVRLAARAGIDRMRNGRDWYPAWGAEFSWLPSVSALPFALPSNVGLELGLQGNALTRNDVLDLYNAYGFAGAKWSFLPEEAANPVVGARALAGATWHSRGQETADAGAELRAGVEGAGYSILAGVGLTRHYQRFGLDAGLSF